MDGIGKSTSTEPLHFKMTVRKPSLYFVGCAICYPDPLANYCGLVTSYDNIDLGH